MFLRWLEMEFNLFWLNVYAEDPIKLLRGRMYSKEIVDKIRELLPRLEKSE